MACERIEKCPLFPKLIATLEFWQVAYCKKDTDWNTCVRYQLFKQGQPVPVDLLPNGDSLSSKKDEKKT